MRNMPLELERTVGSAAVNDRKDVSVVPQFVSILNNQGLKPFVEVAKNCISPDPPLPPPCFGKPPPPPCVGGPPEPCYGPPPPCYGGCYGR